MTNLFGRLVKFFHRHNWSDLKQAAPPFWHVTSQKCNCGLERWLEIKPECKGSFMNKENHLWSYSDGSTSDCI